MEIQRDYLPHGVTENEFLERLNPEELEEIQKDIAYTMIRRKTFNDARVLKKWQIIIDATELDEGYQKKNDYYLSRCYNRGESNECTKYHRSVLEAKLYLGHNLLCSIATETIQNSEEYISQSEAKVKQDCESKAFIRLAEKIKKHGPKINLEQIKGFIDEVPYITELQKTFYKRFEQILKPVYDMVMSEKQEMSESNMTM